ncbi:MAG: peptidoglycan DD-metalloendopeptidase family protein [Bacteroidia bacterium]|nr:peptidoglycan DD-metalloendopeptidase family protein [Bacteroidia bacterium]
MNRKLRLFIPVLLALVVSVPVFYLTRQPQNAVTSLKKVLDEPQPRVEYGINLEPFHLCVGEIKPNQNLSEILSEFGVPYSTIHELAEASREVFDVRKLRPGKPYCILQAQDSSHVRYFIYEHDPINYVVFEMGDSLRVSMGQKEVETREKIASGTIQSSLSQTMADENLPFELAIRLSEVYAWAIDFYRLQKGDRFRVVYEEKFIEGQSVGLGEVRAAQFNHYEKDNFAFLYSQDSSRDYYDENGMSLRKAFLKAPLKYSRISSGFTHKRFHPIYKRYTTHLGIDYAAPIGTPILAVGDGVITDARYGGNNGNFVKIRHNGTYSTQYLHMSKIANGIRPGVRVQQGQVIGYVGSTGLSTGPHLCYRFWKNGQQVNPFKEEIPPAEPIRAELKADFDLYKAQYLEKLSTLNFYQEASGSQVPEEGQVSAE